MAEAAPCFAFPTVPLCTAGFAAWASPDCFWHSYMRPFKINPRPLDLLTTQRNGSAASALHRVRRETRSAAPTGSTTEFKEHTQTHLNNFPHSPPQNPKPHQNKHHSRQTYRSASLLTLSISSALPSTPSLNQPLETFSSCMLPWIIGLNIYLSFFWHV